MNNTEIMENDNFELNNPTDGNTDYIKSYDFTSTKEAEIFEENITDFLSDELLEKAEFRIEISNTSYETDEDMENDINGWVVTDIIFNVDNLNTLETKHIVDTITKSLNTSPILKRNFYIGKVREEGANYYSKIYLDIEVSILKDEKISFIDGKTKITNGKLLSISGDVKIGNRHDMAGQIYDFIEENIEKMEFDGAVSKSDVLTIINIWKTYHLNDMKSGTKKQTDIINEAFERSGKNYDYSIARKILETHPEGSLISDNGYEYGSGWLFEHLPSNVIKKLNTAINPTINTQQSKKSKNLS